uniref:Reverse transcriptase domain-containing protein n=1 Tax=Schistocephalus solidus TaxID=70667 RepID=A0A183SWE8_SCHSO
LDLPPSLPKTIRAVQQISNGKAPGSDAIPPEIYKCGGPRLMVELIALFQEMLCQSRSCSRKANVASTGTAENQCDLCHRQEQEKCEEVRTHLYTTFVDLTKAFDMVNRDGLWKVMQKFGIRSDQRSEAGLRIGSHPAKSHVLGYADGRLP